MRRAIARRGAQFKSHFSINNHGQPATGIGAKGVQRAMAVEVPLDPAKPGGETTELLLLGESQIEAIPGQRARARLLLPPAQPVTPGRQP